MMEHRFRSLLIEQNDNNFTNIDIKSRSISTDYEPEGSPASSQGVEVMRDSYNCSMDSHRSTLLTDADVTAATMIIPVKRDLGKFVSTTFQHSGAKIFNLSEDIQDPWHAPVSVFRSCVQQIDRLLPEVLPELVLRQSQDQEQKQKNCQTT
jgi:protein-tyrosine-phosphatase